MNISDIRQFARLMNLTEEELEDAAGDVMDYYFHACDGSKVCEPGACGGFFAGDVKDQYTAYIVDPIYAELLKEGRAILVSLFHDRVNVFISEETAITGMASVQYADLPAVQKNKRSLTVCTALLRAYIIYKGKEKKANEVRGS